MELLDLAGLAGHAKLPESLTRYYRDRFLLFVPTVRVGRTLLHPPEAAVVIAEIDRHAARGATAEEIEEFLQRVFPVSVFTSQGIPADDGETGARGALALLAESLDQRGVQVQAALAELQARLEERTTKDARPAHPALPGAGVELILAGLEEIHGRLGGLASREQLEWIGDVVSAATVQSPAIRTSPALEADLLRLAGEVQATRVDLAPVPAALAELARAVEQTSHEAGGRAARAEAETERQRAAIASLAAEIQALRQAMQARDLEVTKTLRGLALAIRTDLAEIRSALVDRTIAAGDEAVRIIGSNGHHAPAAADEGGADPRGLRSPRRLGQQPKGSADAGASEVAATGS